VASLDMPSPVRLARRSWGESLPERLRESPCLQYCRNGTRARRHDSCGTTRPVVLIRRSDDVDRECLLLAGVAASAAVTERARVTIAPSDDCHLWRHGSTGLSGAASSAESIGSHSGNVFWVCCLARHVWDISLVVHSPRVRRADRSGAPRGPYVRLAGVPRGPSGIFAYGSRLIPPRGKPLHAHKHFFPRGKPLQTLRHSVPHPDVGFPLGNLKRLGCVQDSKGVCEVCHIQSQVSFTRRSFWR